MRETTYVSHFDNK